MSIICEKCGKTFKGNSGKAAHIRYSKSCGSLYALTKSGKLGESTNLSNKQRSISANFYKSKPTSPSTSQIMIAKNEPKNEPKDTLFKKEPEIIKEPNFEEFTSNWLDEYEETTESVTNDKTQNDKDFYSADNDNTIESVDSAFTLSAEQYRAFFVMLNDFLDTLVSLAGGEEVYSLMKDATLDNLALSTKAYSDSLNFQLSPAKMMMVSVALAYSVPTTRALKSIRANRRKLRAINNIQAERKISKSELDSLQRDVKIDFLDGLDE